MFERDDYPAGVPCWVDLIEADLDQAMAFYSGLFDWTFEIRTPPSAPARYAYARLDGHVIGGVGGPPIRNEEPPGWTSYVCVDSVDATLEAVHSAGGRVVTPAIDIPRSGRVAVCADPMGAVFGLWQPNELHGSQVVNAPGSWNFSELHTDHQSAAEAFYGTVFGWECEALEMGDGSKTAMWRLPGYGAFLAQRDPEIRERQAADQAPGGFADAVALMLPESSSPAEWTVTFAVADADATAARAIELGGTMVVPLFDTQYTRMGTVRDPQGAPFTISHYRPPSR